MISSNILNYSDYIVKFEAISRYVYEQWERLLSVVYSNLNSQIQRKTKHILDKNNPTFKEIQNNIELFLEINDCNILTRKREIVECRQLCMYFAKKLTKKSLRTIGWYFGRKDHATVLHAVKTIDNLIETDREFYDKFKYFAKDIFGKDLIFNEKFEKSVF
jgi:hypothetical protein